MSELANKTGVANNISLKNQERLADDPGVVASLFNDYFIDSPRKIFNVVSPPSNNSNSVDTDCSFSLFLHPFVEDELLHLINCKLKGRTSAGPDDIPTNLVKNIFVHILEPVTYLINLSFITGCFPNSLKLSKVVPVYKKGNSQSVDNYRPVTISSSFSKIFEYCFLDRFTKFLDKNNILSCHQHGFRSSKSTVTALMNFYTELVSFIEAGECPVGSFVTLVGRSTASIMLGFCLKCILMVFVG